MTCKKATYKNHKGARRVTYEHDDGHTVVHEDGSRSWRNNNPGNLKGAISRRVGVDADGFDIYPDLQTGENARRRMFEPGGKYYSYGSIRQVLGGLKDGEGKLIKGTAYAPAADGNNPDRYADHIREWTGIDVDNKKIADLTSGEKDLLEDAMKRQERWRVGNVCEYDRHGNLVHNYIPGPGNPGTLEEDDSEGWELSMFP